MFFNILTGIMDFTLFGLFMVNFMGKIAEVHFLILGKKWEKSDLIRSHFNWQPNQ